jgi:hypothetical protein
MPLILIRVQGLLNPDGTIGNNSVAQDVANARITATSPVPSKAACPPAVAPSTAGFFVCSGGFVNGAMAAVHNDAIVDVIGAGKDGLRGLANNNPPNQSMLYAGWVNNLVAGGVDSVANYRDGAGVVHSRIYAFVQPPAHTVGQVFLPPPPPPPPPPALIPQGMPVLDVSTFGILTEGTGGNTAVGTEGAPGPPVPIVKSPRPRPGGAGSLGQRWRVEMWDSPRLRAPAGHGGFPGSLIDFRSNLDFRSDLVFWTNISGKPGPTPDAACQLYSTVQTNTWNIRFAVTFDAAGGATITTPLAITLTKDPQPGRLATPVAGSGLEVRAPIALRLLIVNARN